MHRRVVALLVALVLVPVAFPATPGGASATVAPSFTTYAGPTGDSVFQGVVVEGYGGGEPSLGVNWRTNAVLFQHGFDTYRVSFGAGSRSTWEDVSPGFTLYNVDPMLFTDSATGRTFAGGLDGMCSVMGITEDDGETWLPAGNMCVPTLDHQSIASGPWAGPVPPDALLPRATYYCAQAAAVTCIMSADGGFTWGAPVPVSCVAQTPGLHGSVHVGPNGHVFLPFRNCGGKIGVARSFDNGLTWTSAVVGGSQYPGHGFDPDVATTPSGWLYIGYEDAGGRAMAALSKDNGTTWTAPFDLGASVGVRTSTFHETVAGDDDRAMVAFLGTTTPGDAFDPSFTGVWDLYVAATYDAGATWTTVKATTDPVQRGWICDRGTGCPSDGPGGAQDGRNLLDFMDAQVDATGRVLIGYADGCLGCAGPDDSDASAAAITRQTGGLTLFSRFDPTSGGIAVSGGGPYRGAPGAPVALAALADHGDAPYSYAWSVVARPQGSDADDASFSAADVASPTFTPDVAGEYALRVEARDADGDAAVDVVALVASAVAGLPLPTCAQTVATDVAGDASARRDITSLAASDDDATFTVCIGLAQPDASPGTATRYAVSWTPSWEPDVVTYRLVASIQGDGSVANAGLQKGVLGSTASQLGGPATAERAGDALRITVAKSSIGAPPDGASAVALSARSETSSTPATVFDETPTGDFTFGARLADATPPSQVAGLAVADTGTGRSLALSWDPATDDVALADYVVRRAESAAGPFRTVAIVEAASHLDESLVEGVRYHYTVLARDASGNLGAPSAVANATPVGPPDDATPPTAPGALAAANVTEATVDLSWTAADDAESGVALYRVLRDGALLGATTATGFHDAPLEAETTYLYEVLAVNGEGLAGPAASLSVTTPARPPDCGQVEDELVADPLHDALVAGARADIARVSVRETATRLWFHVGLRNATMPGEATMVRVGWMHEDEPYGFAVYARLTDEGVFPAGTYVRTAFAANEVSLQRNPQVGLMCSSVLIGVQKADVLSPMLLSGLDVRVGLDSYPLSSPWDRAPDAGTVSYAVEGPP